MKSKYVLFHWHDVDVAGETNTICMINLRTGVQETMNLDRSYPAEIWVRMPDAAWTTVEEIRTANNGESAVILDVWEE